MLASSQRGGKEAGRSAGCYTKENTFREAGAVQSHSPTLFSSFLPLITHNSLSTKDYWLQMRTYKLMLRQYV